MAQVKTTKITKKWTDRKTGEKKELTIDYAKVNDRLKQFREVNPRGLIDTAPKIINNTIVFKARILTDKSDQNSAEATGHALGNIDGSEKQFEKLETIAVGRALALLGYSVGGEIASDEEMHEFTKWKDDQIEIAIDTMNQTKTLGDLRKCFIALGSLMSDSRIIGAKDAKKAELSKEVK